VAVFVQPLPSVPATVYVVVAAGLAVTVEPVVPDKPLVGLHTYVVAPVAVSVVLNPEQIDAGEAEAVTAGSAFMTTVAVDVTALHPPDTGVV